MAVLTDAQNVAFAQVRKVLKEWKGRDSEGLRSALAEIGFPIVLRRVTWSGGVGSFKVMRGGICRVQVRASCWGFKRRAIMIGGRVALSASGELGYKYADCIEILPNGKGNFENYYNTHSRAAKKSLQEPKKKLFRLKNKSLKFR